MTVESSRHSTTLSKKGDGGRGEDREKGNERGRGKGRREYDGNDSDGNMYICEVSQRTHHYV